VRYNRDGGAREVFDYHCKVCQKKRKFDRDYRATGSSHGKRRPHEFTGWQDPIDRLFFCKIKTNG